MMSDFQLPPDDCEAIGSARKMSKRELVEALRHAVSENALDEAIRLSASLRRRFPDHHYGWKRGVIALRASDRSEECEALALEAGERFREMAWFRKVAAEMAIRRKDWPTAQARSLALRQQFPDDPAGYLTAHRPLIALDRIDDAQALAAEGLARFASEAWPYKHALECALKRRDWASAVVYAEGLRARAPGDPAGVEGGVVALCQLRRLEEARGLASHAVAAFPERPEVKRIAVRLASFASFLEDDERLGSLASMAPSDLAPRLAWAQHASRIAREDFGWGEIVLDRLRAVHLQFPDAEDVIVAYVKELAAQGHFDAADHVSAPCLSRLGDLPALASAWVNVAHRGRAFEEAVRRARAARALFPDHSEFATAEVRALVELVAAGAQDLHEEVEAICAAALRTFPDEEELYDFHGLLAQLDGDLRTALARWQTGLKRFAQVAQRKCDFHRRTVDASLALDRSAVANEPLVNQVPLAEESQLMVRFQSLGSTLFGCEFGGVQRYFGAEPLHLLRWISCPVGQLTHALEEKFAAFGTEDDLSLYVERDEYKMRSARYRMRLHTSIRPSEAPWEKALSQMRRRCQFLARRLDEELTSSDRKIKSIFVYKHYVEHVSDEEVRQLFTALNRHGRNALLSVRTAGDSHSAGTVRMVEPFFMIGYLEHFGKTALGVPLETQNTLWLQICGKAARMIDNLASDSSPPDGFEARA